MRFPNSTHYQVLNDEGIALRGLFIIDKEGVLQHSTINNLGFGRSVDETLRVLQALQYVQSHPDEVRRRRCCAPRSANPAAAGEAVGPGTHGSRRCPVCRRRCARRAGSRARPP